MVILIDSTAYRAKGIMAVGQHIGQGEFFQAAGSGCLHLELREVPNWTKVGLLD